MARKAYLGLELSKRSGGVRKKQLGPLVIIPSQQERHTEGTAHLLLFSIFGEVEGQVTYALCQGLHPDRLVVTIGRGGRREEGREGGIGSKGSASDRKPTTSTSGIFQHRHRQRDFPASSPCARFLSSPPFSPFTVPKSMILRLHPSMVHQRSGIRHQARHGSTNMGINLHNLLHARRFQQGRGNALFHSEDDAMFGADPHGCRP